MSHVLQHLRQLAASSPDSSAVIGSEYTLSWSALNLAVAVLADELRSSGTIGLYLDNSPAWLISDLAAIDADSRNIPLPTFFSNEQLQHAITDGCIDTIITDNPARLVSITGAVEQTPVKVAKHKLTLLRLKQDKRPVSSTDKITYTSGTTGTPKGVILPLTHIETVAQSLCEASQANSSDRALIMLPLSTLLENIGSIYVPILAGAQIIVPDPEETGLSGSSGMDITAFVTMLNKYRPTTMIVPPQLLKLLLALAAQGQLPDTFRYIAVGGAPVGSALLQQAQSLGLPVYQGYGLSEACSVVAVNSTDAQRMGAVGKPLPHTHVRISDEGEVMVSGTIYEGYLNQTAQTSSELATGDLGYLDDEGYLFITGRRKNVLITGYGRNISPEWLESELQAHPDIAQAAIFGNGRAFLTAMLVPSASLNFASKGQLSRLITALETTISEINRQLPDYAQIAQFIVAEEAFNSDNGELTVNGRPRRDVIGQHYAQQISAIYEDQHEHIL